MVKTVLWFIVSLNIAAMLSGCSATTWFGSARHAKPQFAVYVPPNKVGYGGHMTTEDKQLLLDVLDKMLKKPYKNHHYWQASGLTSKNESSTIESQSFSATTSMKKR